MNWLYPRDTMDLLFPGLLWYSLVWIIMACVFCVAVTWKISVWVFKLLTSN